MLRWFGHENAAWNQKTKESKPKHEQNKGLADSPASHVALKPRQTKTRPKTRVIALPPSCDALAPPPSPASQVRAVWRVWPFARLGQRRIHGHLAAQKQKKNRDKNRTLAASFVSFSPVVVIRHPPSAIRRLRIPAFNGVGVFQRQAAWVQTTTGCAVRAANACFLNKLLLLVPMRFVDPTSPTSPLTSPDLSRPRPGYPAAHPPISVLPHPSLLSLLHAPLVVIVKTCVHVVACWSQTCPYLVILITARLGGHPHVNPRLLPWKETLGSKSHC